MTHLMKLQPGPFEKIARGEKTVELRLLDEKRSKIRPGDEIEFTNLASPGEKLRTVVLALHRFDSFEQLYKCLPMEKCGYSPGESADFRDMEAYYSKEEQARFGVVGIEISKI